ncbi:GGDEF domain-containing protein [Actinoplanes sp. NPDC049548]|uniref:GGDEF domain-containing protein n=1 Tax=Actinoplanes sp. NPDC049548 TaxID=3155152 RepID=UPI00343E6EC6
MNDKTQPWRFGMLPLTDRIRWSTSLRVGLGVAVGLLWLLQPGQRRTDSPALLMVAVGFALAAVVTLAAPLVGRRTAILAVNVALLVDGVALACALHAYGGITGVVSVLMLLHVCGVSLLTSFRSGGKVAVWHALVVLCILQAEQVGLLTNADGPFPFAPYLTFVVLLGTAALATSSFAALNERELRRRRYDAEVLRSLAVGLETSADYVAIATALARTAVEDMLGARALVVVQPVENDEESRGLRPFEAAWPALPPSATPLPAPGHESILSSATDTPILAQGLEPHDDAYLLSRLPGAQHLAILPIPIGAAGQGWLVVDMGTRKRVENRMMSTLQQAVAHVGLALSRAVLVERLRLAAETDGLTGLTNRKTFDTAFSRLITESHRTGEALAVALVDLDFFKKINDTYGHQAGDDTLRAAAAALRSTARGADVVARYGGEEFAVILPGVDAATAWEAGERFRVAVAGCAAPVPVTCSIGIACLSVSQGSVVELLESADQALYRAKDGGRNRVEVGYGTQAAMPAESRA